MYCLTIRDAHNNCWAKNYYFNTLEEANNWSNALCSLYDNKEAFEGYQWGISEVKSTKLTLDKFMKGHGLNKCRHTTIACPEYVGEDFDFCYKCRTKQRPDGPRMEWLYSVTIIRKMQSLEDGHLWSDMMPDELHQEKYNFDGWEAGMLNQMVKTYELFWYPQTIELATELITLLDSMKEHTLFEDCDFKLTILPRSTKTKEA